MNDKNLFLLAALGIGAYLFMTKTAAGATVAARLPQTGTGGAQTAAPSTRETLISGGVGLLGQWLGNRATAQQIATEQASEIAYYGAAADGQAVNVAQVYNENYYRGDN